MPCFLVIASILKFQRLRWKEINEIIHIGIAYSIILHEFQFSSWRCLFIIIIICSCVSVRVFFILFVDARRSTIYRFSYLFRILWYFFRNTCIKYKHRSVSLFYLILLWFYIYAMPQTIPIFYVYQFSCTGFFPVQLIASHRLFYLSIDIFFFVLLLSARAFFYVPCTFHFHWIRVWLDWIIHSNMSNQSQIPIIIIKMCVYMRKYSSIFT